MINDHSNTVSVINASTYQVVGTVTVGTSPVAVAMSGGYAYVSNNGSVEIPGSTVSVISPIIGAVAIANGVEVQAAGSVSFTADSGALSVH